MKSPAYSAASYASVIFSIISTNFLWIWFWETYKLSSLWRRFCSLGVPSGSNLVLRLAIVCWSSITLACLSRYNGLISTYFLRMRFSSLSLLINSLSGSRLSTNRGSLLEVELNLLKKSLICFASLDWNRLILKFVLFLKLSRSFVVFSKVDLSSRFSSVYSLMFVRMERISF